mmetsp:Transcript_29203/g.67222  ORF Transcript_29203/g.67222 Transcript_29203/m.67222 type:complete len:388 (-) Transcript_29203:114-1277(-)
MADSEDAPEPTTQEDVFKLSWQNVVASAKIPAIDGLQRYDEESLKKLVVAFEGKASSGGVWNQFQSFEPDLAWHVPTCDENSWKHTDVLLELGEGIGYITLNRPQENNCINEGILEGLCDAVYILHRRTDIRLACFAANGPMFCGGDDPERVTQIFNGSAKWAKPKQVAIKQHLDALMERFRRQGMSMDYAQLKEALLWSTLTKLPSVTIGVVTGSVVGTGIGLLACLDLAITNNNALFRMPDLKEGVLPTALLPYIVQKVGSSVVRRLLVGGEVMNADDAKSADLVQEIIETDKGLTDWIWDISDAVTACGPKSVKAAKQLVLNVGGQPIGERIMFFTASMLQQVTVSDEADVGMKCLQAKQPKPWEVTPITPLYGENPHPERRTK